MDEDKRTLWCGNLSDKVTEEILYELFLQGGPVQRVCIPKDRNGKQRTFGFVTYKHINSVSYALRLFDGTMLFNRPLSMNARNNVESPTESMMDQSLNLNQMLQLGQQMILGSTPSRMRVQMFGMNMLSDFASYPKQLDVFPCKDDRRSKRAHPYRVEENKNNGSHRRDHRSRSNHSSRRSEDYSRRDYKNSKRSYR